MNLIQPKIKNRPLLLAIALCLTATTPLAEAEEGVSNSARDFLSDPQRVGSLTGTILGGALTAHPIGTLAGGIIGFFVGKQTMHKSPEQLAQTSYARRSFIPTIIQETAIPMLALDTSTPEVATFVPTTTLIAPPPLTTTFSATIQQQATLNPSKVTGPVVASVASAPKMFDAPQSVPTPTIATTKQLSPLEQIASLCYGGGQSKASNPDLQALCYYQQSS